MVAVWVLLTPAGTSLGKAAAAMVLERSITMMGRTLFPPPLALASLSKK